MSTPSEKYAHFRSDQEHPAVAEFRALYDTDPDVKKVVDTARGLEGLKRQWGVHAAGVIMSSEPLIDIIPIQRRDSDGAIITQFDMGACETLNIAGFEFLLDLGGTAREGRIDQRVDRER